MCAVVNCLNVGTFLRNNSLIFPWKRYELLQALNGPGGSASLLRLLSKRPRGLDARRRKIGDKVNRRESRRLPVFPERAECLCPAGRIAGIPSGMPRHVFPYMNWFPIVLFLVKAQSGSTTLRPRMSALRISLD